MFKFFRKKESGTSSQDTAPEHMVGDIDDSMLVDSTQDKKLPGFDFETRPPQSMAQWLISHRIALVVFSLFIFAVILGTHLATKPKRPTSSHDSKTVLDAGGTRISSTSLSPGANIAPTTTANPAVAVPATLPGSDNTAIALQVSSVVTAASHGTAHVVDIKPSVAGLTPITYDIDGHRGFAWINLDKKWVILGTILDINGNNLQPGSLAMDTATSPLSDTPGYTDNSPPTGNSSGVVMGENAKEDKAGEVLAAMNSTVGIHDGATSPVKLWVFFDPEDSASAVLFNKSVDVLSSTEVTWIPVMVTNGKSASESAWLMTQINPYASLVASMRRYDTSRKTSSGGQIAPSMEMSSLLVNNTRMLESIAGMTTPTVLFCTKDGTPHVMSNPQDIVSVLQIAGKCGEHVAKKMQ